MKLKPLLGALLLLGCYSGCVLEEEPRHGRVAVVDAGHHHGEGCGHVQVRGVWYERD
jgi:hypothetical protein